MGLMFWIKRDSYGNERSRSVRVEDPLPVRIYQSDEEDPIPVSVIPNPTAPQPSTDAGPAWTSVRQLTTSADMTGAADLTAAPTAGQRIVIDDLIFASDTAMYMSFLEETSGTELFRLYVAANGTVQVTTRGKMKLPTSDKKLRGDASAAGNVAITVLFHSE